MKKVIAVCILATILVVAHAGSDVKKENLLQIFQDMSESTLFEEFMSSSTNSTCPKPGHCGLAYQSCCAGYIASGFPCDCHLQPGTGNMGPNCGDCGKIYAGCCIGYKAKGYPCECDVNGVVLVLLLGEETRSLKHCCTAGEDIRWWIMKFLAFAVSRPRGTDYDTSTVSDRAALKKKILQMASGVSSPIREWWTSRDAKTRQDTLLMYDPSWCHIVCEMARKGIENRDMYERLFFVQEEGSHDEMTRACLHLSSYGTKNGFTNRRSRDLAAKRIDPLFGFISRSPSGIESILSNVANASSLNVAASVKTMEEYVIRSLVIEDTKKSTIERRILDLKAFAIVARYLNSASLAACAKVCGGTLTNVSSSPWRRRASLFRILLRRRAERRLHQHIRLIAINRPAERRISRKAGRREALPSFSLVAIVPAHVLSPLTFDSLMMCVTDGCFLSEAPIHRPCKSTLSSRRLPPDCWSESPWLRRRGLYRLGSFLANQIETLIWRHWTIATAQQTPSQVHRSVVDAVRAHQELASEWTLLPKSEQCIIARRASARTEKENSNRKSKNSSRKADDTTTTKTMCFPCSKHDKRVEAKMAIGCEEEIVHIRCFRITLDAYEDRVSRLQYALKRELIERRVLSNAAMLLLDEEKRESIVASTDERARKKKKKKRKKRRRKMTKNPKENGQDADEGVDSSSPESTANDLTSATINAASLPTPSIDDVAILSDDAEVDSITKNTVDISSASPSVLCRSLRRPQHHQLPSPRSDSSLASVNLLKKGTAAMGATTLPSAVMLSDAQLNDLASRIARRVSAKLAAGSSALSSVRDGFRVVARKTPSTRVRGGEGLETNRERRSESTDSAVRSTSASASKSPTTSTPTMMPTRPVDNKTILSLQKEIAELRAQMKQHEAETIKRKKQGAVVVATSSGLKTTWKTASPLHDEIVQFSRRVTQKCELRAAAKAEALHRVKSAVRLLWPRALILLYGSHANNMCLPSSDVDMVICMPKDTHCASLDEDNAVHAPWQQRLARRLQRCGWIQKVKCHGHPMGRAVAIVRALTNPLGGSPGYSVNLDISVRDGGHNGIATSGVVLSLQREYPALRPLVLVLKQALTRRGLQTAHTGGLCSFGLVLMVARFLQEQEPATWPQQKGVPKSNRSDRKDLGEMLLRFLQFYAHDFDPRTTGISVARRCFFSRASMLDKAVEDGLAGSVNSEGVGDFGQTFYLSPQRSIPRFNYSASHPSLRNHQTTDGACDVHLALARKKTPKKSKSVAHGRSKTILPRRFSFDNKALGSSSSCVAPDATIENSRLRPSDGTANHPTVAVQARSGLKSKMSPEAKAWTGSPKIGGTSPQLPRSRAQFLRSAAVYMRRLPRPFEFDPVLIEDPLFDGNNVGRNCFRIHQVQRAWSEALLALNFGKGLEESLVAASLTKKGRSLISSSGTSAPCAVGE
eukprot:g1923.t1